MTLSTVSTAYLNTALLPAVRQAQAQLANLEVESTTGQYADLGLQLGSQSGYELSLRTQDDLLHTMTIANGLTQTRLSTAQTALSAIEASATTTAKTLTAWNSAGNNAFSLQTAGQTALQQLIATGNTTIAGAYVFGGQNSGVAPINDYYAQPTSAAKTAIGNAFQSYFGFPTTSSQVSTITASQMQAFLSGPYAAQFQGSNWSANWSNASSTNATAEISPGQSVPSSTNANTIGFQQLAQGYTMLSEFGNIGLSVSAAQAVVSTATNLVTKGSGAITDVQASLGVSQSAISQADDSMNVQMTLLQKELARTDSVDAAQVATELTTLTTQLQSAYQLTAKLTQMNLAQYLPT